MIALLVYVGICSAALAAEPSTCAPCHREARDFGASAMAHALSRGSESGVLKSNPKLSLRLGTYSYEIAAATLVVSDGGETLRTPLLWAFGHGGVGQTFLYRLKNAWYESRVSYFGALRGLDITIGQQGITPYNLVEAAGRLTSPLEVSKCFDCHATNAGKAEMSPGVQCERCHGPADAHPGKGMKNLGALTTEEVSDFCGQCHRTWSQVAANGPRGIQNIRFQPYRLAGSKCYDAADPRIKCTACHDPHRPLETSATYDSKCAACHGGVGLRAAERKAGRRPTPQCRVASKDCVTCHMPKLDLPGAHAKFTDHRIRIAKAGAPYPD
jgi:hypothetical protein